MFECAKFENHVALRRRVLSNLYEYELQIFSSFIEEELDQDIRDMERGGDIQRSSDSDQDETQDPAVRFFQTCDAIEAMGYPSPRRLLLRKHIHRKNDDNGNGNVFVDQEELDEADLQARSMWELLQLKKVML